MSRFSLPRQSSYIALPGKLLALSAITLLTLSSVPLSHAQTADTAQRATEDARKAELEAQAKTLRSEADATYNATEPGCYEKFLVNRCIDQAKQQRLETIQRARALEAEARQIELAQRQRAAAEAQASEAQTSTRSA